MSDLIESYRDGRRDPWNLVFSLLVLFVTFAVYLMTVQRTVPFWDCGEFITCAYILGIPHPPGTPLFVLIGNVFSYFPIGDDPSFRINLLSSVSSAFAAMFGYLVAAWLIRKWFADGGRTGWNRVTVYVGALIGGFYFAFGRTNWSNSIETEVYGTSMLFMMVTIYLMLLWIDNRGNPRGEAMLVLMAYLSTLALGIHMTSYIVALFALPLVLLVDRDYRRAWQIWVTYPILLLIVFGVTPFLVVASTWLTVTCIGCYWKRMSEGWIYSLAIPILLSTIVVAKGYPFVPIFSLSFFGWALLTLVVYRLVAAGMFWRISFLVMLASLLGFSSQMFIPIRAAHKPIINMNSPVDWDTFRGFLERKQYGSQNMVSRMFERRAEWANQFGRHPRMGFWGFFEEQYGMNRAGFALLFIIGLIGSGYSVARHWKSGLFVFLIMLAGTVGLVLYMNFADGTRYNPMLQEGHLEVRDRDYFWTPGFVMFALLIGLGIAAILKGIRSMFTRLKVQSAVRNAVLVILCILCIALPYSAIRANYFINDRSRNFIAYDYAWNILQSAREDAVLFTNGDNDTFPVWCLQYVYGIRPDVKIANLSLINTPWYIEQLKNKLGVPISFSDEEIRGLRHQRVGDRGIYRVQDQMIVNIIETNNFRIPIEFAVTVSTDNKVFRDQHLDEYLQMEGMALMLYKHKQPNAINLERTHDLYWDVFRYRGVNDTTIYKDENDSRLVGNYLSGFMVLADTLRRTGQIDEAAAQIYKSIELVGAGFEQYAYLCRIYALHGRIEDAERVLQEAPDTISKTELRRFIASALLEGGHTQKARSYYEEIYAAQPEERNLFRELLAFYYRERMQDELVALLWDWVTRHPEDAEMRRAYEQLMNEMPGLAPPGTTGTGTAPAGREEPDSGAGS